MKYQLLVSIILVMSLNINAQNDSIPAETSSQNHRYQDIFSKGSVKFGTGVFIPQGNLQNYFGSAPLFEINGSLPFSRGRSIDLALQVIVPDQRDDFVYLRTIDTIQAKSKAMVNFFLRFKKELYRSDKSHLNLGLGLGVSSITTDARNPFYDGDEGDNKYELVTAFLGLPGIEWTHSFSSNAEFSFALEVQYSPYKIEGALREDIGSVALIPKVLYKF